MEKCRSIMKKIPKSYLVISLSITLAFFLTIASPFVATWVLGSGANYYVDGVNGSDSNPGTSVDRAWKTIQKAANTMVGGDTVYIRGGRYNERVTLEYKGNSSGPYITFAAYPGEQPILDGTGIDIDQGGLFHILVTDYVRVSGLRVEHSNRTGIYAGNSNQIILQRNSTYDTVKSGIGIWGGTNVIVDGNDVALACNSHPNYPASEENISVASGSFNVEVKNNYVHQAASIPDGYSGGEGINIKDGSHDVQVHHNIVRLDGRQDGKPSNRLAFGLDGWSHETYNVSFYDNIAYNNKSGFVIESEAGATARDIYVYNNIAYNNSYAGFYMPNWAQNETSLKKNIQFINNLAYHNGIGININSIMVENVIIRNNILSQNTNTQIQVLVGAQPQTFIDHTLYFGQGNPKGSDYLIGDPLFIDPDNANFRLQNLSPAIDHGNNIQCPGIDMDNISRPVDGNGDAIPICDIGSFEYMDLNGYSLLITQVIGGIIKADPQGPYHLNDPVTLTVIEDVGWSFSSWIGDCAGQSNPCTLIMNNDKSVSAIFIPTPTYTNTPTPTYIPTPTSTNIPTITASPTSTPTFMVTQNATSTAAPTDSPTAPPNQTATIFPSPTSNLTTTPTATSMPSQAEYTLIINISGNGSVTKNPDKMTYNGGDVVQLTAIPDRGWSFNSWSGDIDGTTNPIYITIDGNKTVTTNFTALSTVTLSITQTQGGSIVAEPTGPYYMGQQVVLYPIAGSGYTFFSWTNDATGTSTPMTIIMDSDKTVGAYFQLGTSRESFDTLSPWVQKGSGTKVLDRDNRKEKIASIKLILPKKNGFITITKNVNWDLKSPQEQGTLRFWLYVSDAGSLTNFQIILSNDNNFKNFFYASIPITNGWNLITLNSSDWQKSSEKASWNSPIIRLQFRAEGSGGAFFLIDGLTTGNINQP